MSNLIRRLAKIEGATGEGDIAIWVDDEDQVALCVDELIAAGEISEADRRRCVHWSKARATSGGQEAALDKLQTWEAEPQTRDELAT